MNKEEILKKSRIEKIDEGNLFILNNGSRYGSMILLSIIIPLILFTFFTWRLAESALLMTVLWGFLTGNYIGHRKAIQEKKKGLIIVSCIFTIICFMTYLNQAFFV